MEIDKTKLVEMCIRKLQKSDTLDMVQLYVINTFDEEVYKKIEDEIDAYLNKYGRKRKYWILKVKMSEWEESEPDEFYSIEKGFVYPQYFKISHTKPMNNIDDILFMYNKSNNSQEGVYLVCKIVTKMDNENAIELEVLKDLRDNPYFYKESFPKLYSDYNTMSGKNKRQQFSMIVEEQYNPEALYNNILNIEE